jgi:hypothetical protein
MRIQKRRLLDAQASLKFFGWKQRVRLEDQTTALQEMYAKCFRGARYLQNKEKAFKESRLFILSLSCGQAHDS